MDVENKDESQLLSRMKVNKNDLMGEMVIQPKLVAISGGKLEALQYKYDLLEHQIDVLEAQLFLAASKKYSAEKPNLKFLDAKVKSDKRLRALKIEQLNVKRVVGMTKARYKGLLTKTEMLKEIAYNSRKEMEQGVVRRKARVQEKATNQ